MLDYLVFVINDFNEQMTFRFREIHDALTLYCSAKHDSTVNHITVNCLEYDESNPESFLTGHTIRYYDRD